MHCMWAFMEMVLPRGEGTSVLGDGKGKVCRYISGVDTLTLSAK